MNQSRIDALTGIRGIAALWVLVHHLVTQYPLQDKLPVFVTHIAEKGWLGVDLFFILSGFVIAFVHNKDFKTHIDIHTVKNFLIKRIARIYPVHLVTTLSLIPIYLAAKWSFGYSSPIDAFSLNKLLYSLTLTNGFGFQDSIGWNAPSWSVSSEFLAYLTFPFLAALFLQKQLSIKASLGWIILIFIVTTSIGWFQTDKARYIAGWQWVSLRVLSEFMFGIFIFQIYRLNLKAPFSVLAFISSVIIITMSVTNTESHWDWIMILSFGLLIYSLTNTQHNISRFLSKNKMIYLGEISYSIYLCHGIIFMILNSAFKKTIPDNNGFMLVFSLCIYIITPIIIAHFMYKYVELPAQSYLKKKFLKN